MLFGHESMIGLTDVVFNQIMLTLATWGRQPMTGSKIQLALGNKGNPIYQSSVSATLNSGINKGAYVKIGAKKHSRFYLDFNKALPLYMERFRFLPSDRAISLARNRARLGYIDRYKAGLD